MQHVKSSITHNAAAEACMRLSIQPSFSTFYAGDICSLCPFPSNPAFSMLQCFPVSVSRSVSYAMRANFMFPNLSGGLGAVCGKLDMGMLAERPGGFPPNNRRLLSSRTMSAKPHVSVANACSTSRCLPLRPRLAPGALPGGQLDEKTTTRTSQAGSIRNRLRRRSEPRHVCHVSRLHP